MPKENLDLQKHCGVTIAPSGLPCLRSLACKSHSLASKRAVIGRLRDFDSLLADYNKAHPSKGRDLYISSLLLLVVVKTDASKNIKTDQVNIFEALVPEISKKNSKTPSQDITENIGPLIRKNTSTRISIISKIRLAQWLGEPLKLYTRTRINK